jgi:hypothetical protein
MDHDKYFIGWGHLLKTSINISVGDVHQTLKSRLESPSSGVSSALLGVARQYWSIPAAELNLPTAAYYASDLFEKLPFDLRALFEGEHPKLP